MKIKAEVFKAKDAIDDQESFFIIYSVNGEDVWYNCMPADCTCEDEMISKSKGSFIRWNDNPHAPRRADMIEPELIEVFYLDK